MWVDLIAVRKKFQNRGIGKILLKYAEEKAKESSLEVLTGLVKSDNILHCQCLKIQILNMMMLDLNFL